MSQSDYITYKKMKLLNNEINKTPSHFPNILPTNQYNDFKDFYLENTITNTKTIYHQVTPPNKHIIFNMEVQDISNCTFYGFCINTNQRKNRVLQPRNLLSQSNSPLYNYVPTYDTQYRTAVMNSGLSANQKKILMNEFLYSNKVEPMYNHNETIIKCESIPCIHQEKILGTL